MRISERTYPGWSAAKRCVIRERPSRITRARFARSMRATRFSPHPRSQHHDLGADRRALVEIEHVLVEHADAAGRDAVADGPGLVGAVDAVQGILVALPQIERAGAERIAQAARHADAAAQLAHVPHQLGLARQHLPGRIPVRPFLLVVDARGAGPAETLASDADAVAHRLAPALD